MSNQSSQRPTPAIQINHSVVSTLNVRSTDPFRLDFTHDPPKHHWGSERHHSSRTPRGTFDGETVVAQKPALGTAKTAGQGWSAGGLCACPSGTTNIATFIGKPDSRQRAVITFQHPLPAIRRSSSKVLDA